MPGLLPRLPQRREEDGLGGERKPPVDGVVRQLERFELTHQGGPERDGPVALRLGRLDLKLLFVGDDDLTIGCRCGMLWLIVLDQKSACVLSWLLCQLRLVMIGVHGEI